MKSHDDFEAFWITNAIAVRGVHGPVLGDIISDCADDIDEVRQISLWQRPPLPPRERLVDGASPASSDPQWIIKKVGADNAWADGYDGTGIVVATLVGGVRYTHDTRRQLQVDAHVNNGLATTIIGRIGHTRIKNHWTHGHGTNVQGILSGSAVRVGVVPLMDLRKIFNLQVASKRLELSGDQWAMCPTDLVAIGNCS